MTKTKRLNKIAHDKQDIYWAVFERAEKNLQGIVKIQTIKEYVLVINITNVSAAVKKGGLFTLFISSAIT